MQKVHNVLEITETAKNNTFEECEFHGGVKIAGSGTKMIKTRIYEFKKKHPILSWIGIIASLATIVGFILQVL